MLDRIGYTAKVRDKTLKFTLDTLVANLSAVRIVFADKGTVRVEYPDGQTRNKAAELICTYFGLAVSRQPEALRLKHAVEVVRPAFAVPGRVIDRPVADG
jgi:hypothetical protein